MGHALSHYAPAASASCICISFSHSSFYGLSDRAAMAIASTISLVLIVSLTITPMMIERYRTFPNSMRPTFADGV
jgi:hypothetical protein